MVPAVSELSSPAIAFVLFASVKSPLKMMENDFYFNVRALFILTIFRFLSSIFDHTEKIGLIRQISLISKFVMSQPG